MSTPTFKKQFLWLWVAILLFIGIFFGIACWKYLHNGYNALDLAIFNQTMFATLNGALFGSSIHPPSYFADHVSPVLFVLVPIYVLWSHPLMLVLAQITGTALCALPLFLITRRSQAEATTSLPLVIVIAWLLNPLVHNVALYEFHVLSFAMVAVLWAVYFFQKNSFYWFVVWCLLALMCREDIALIVGGFGVIALALRKPWRWTLFPLLTSGFYLLIATQLTTFFGADSYKFSVYYGWLNNFFPFFLDAPLRVIAHFINLRTIEWALLLLFPLAGIPIAGRRSLVWLWLLAGPTAQFALGGSGLSATLLQIHYAALFLPALFCAAIFGLTDTHQLFNRMVARIGVKKLVPITGALITTTLYTAALLGPLPLTVRAMIVNQSPKDSVRNWVANRATGEDTLVASYDQLSALSSRQKIASFNYVFLGYQQFLTTPYALPHDTRFAAIDFNDWLAFQAQYENQPIYRQAYAQALSVWPAQLGSLTPVEARGAVVLYESQTTDQLLLTQPLSQFQGTADRTATTVDEDVALVAIEPDGERYKLVTTIKHVPLDWWRYYVRLTDADGNHTHLPLGYGMLGQHQPAANPYLAMWVYPDSAQTYSTAQLVRIDHAGVELTPWRSIQIVIDAEKLFGEPIFLPALTSSELDKS